MYKKWREDPKPTYPPIEGWWTIGEAPNYEINDEGIVRHKLSGREIVHRTGKKGEDSEYRYVSLSANGTIIGRSVQQLVETGRKYQER